MKHTNFCLFIITTVLVLVFPVSLLAQGEGVPIKDDKPKTPKATKPKPKPTPSDSSVTIGKSNSDQNKSEPNNSGITKKENTAEADLKEESIWKSVSESRDPVDYQNYLKQYPTGKFADTARAKVQELEEQRKTDATNKSTANIDSTTSPTTSPLQPFIAGNLTERAISLPKPIFPEKYKKIKELWGAKVTVAVTIDENGKVIFAKATMGPDSLRQAAETAAKQAVFPKTVILGQPMQVTGSIYYEFEKP